MVYLTLVKSGIYIIKLLLKTWTFGNQKSGALLSRLIYDFRIQLSSPHSLTSWIVIYWEYYLTLGLKTYLHNWNCNLILYMSSFIYSDFGWSYYLKMMRFYSIFYHIIISYKNTFYNYDELQMSSCAVYVILNTVLVYINRKLVHAEYISICSNASNTCHKHMREKQL